MMHGQQNVKCLRLINQSSGPCTRQTVGTMYSFVFYVENHIAIIITIKLK